MNQESGIKNQEKHIRNEHDSLFMIHNSLHGFTLIELLVVMVVLLVVGTIVGATLFSAFRGANKTNIISTVRQNGNFAATQMTKMIRYAKQFEGVSQDGSSFTSPVLDPTVCTYPAPTPYPYLKIKSWDDGDTIFGCTGDTIASNSASLLDVNTVTLPDNTRASCSFSCIQANSLSSPTINIKFTLQQKASPAFFENVSSIPFETSVTMRNTGL